MTDFHDLRIIKSMIEKCERLIEVCKAYKKSNNELSYVFSDSIQFEFEKLYEDSTRLSVEFISSHKEIEITKLKGIRNRVAHDYESVSIEILIDTIEKDIPELLGILNLELVNNKG